MTDIKYPAPLTEDTLFALLRAICSRTNLSFADPQLIKFTNNAVFHLPHADVVVRIAGSETIRARASEVVLIARWLEANRIPSVRLCGDWSQPIEVEGHLATIWSYVPTVSGSPTGAEMGTILGRLHALEAPSFKLSDWNILQKVRSRIAEAERLPDYDQELLLEHTTKIENRVQQLRYILPQGPIHGDAFLGNVINGPDGAIICDFDSFSIGPREWDFVPIAVGKIRFRYPDDSHDSLVSKYGFNVVDWPGFEVLREVRELQLVTSVLPVLANRPSLYAQWKHRYESFIQGDKDATWEAYS